MILCTVRGHAASENVGPEARIARTLLRPGGPEGRAPARDARETAGGRTEFAHAATLRLPVRGRQQG